MLGVASAEAPTTASPPPTVSVQGVAIEPIEQSASSATATTVYRQGMAAAITDGQAKAQFLASSAGVTLGAVQGIVENGGYIGCTGNEVEYLGEQPDFGSPGVGVSPDEVSGPRVGRRGNARREQAGRETREEEKAQEDSGRKTCERRRLHAHGAGLADLRDQLTSPCLEGRAGMRMPPRQFSWRYFPVKFT